MLPPRDISPKGVRPTAGFAALGLAALAAWLCYAAIRAEITGEARSLGPRLRTVARRDTSPARFREYTNLTWAAGGFCGLTGILSFVFYRRLGEHA
jgi:hypothetical protein